MTHTQQDRREDVGAEGAQYVVIENTPGYMPEDEDPFVTDDLGAARECLKDMVERHCEWCDEAGMTYDVWWSEDLTAAEVSNRSGFTYDLGRCFAIVESEES
jgi:hypothetical protein